MTDLYRRYETVYILRPNLGMDRVNELHKRSRDIIEADGGIFLKQDLWGKRALAYDIKRESKGVYVFMEYIAPTGGLHKRSTVSELERTMRNDDAFLRYMTVQLDTVEEPSEFTSIEARPVVTEAKQLEVTHGEERKADARAPRGGDRSRAPRDDDDDDGIEDLD